MTIPALAPRPDAAGVRIPQRLVVCLDGTWNNQSDSTNVLQHYALVVEGLVTDSDGRQFIQKKHYVQGVGTGVLDRLTGGGFGIGLEENVRAGYNWIIQHFHGKRDDFPGDEIYIFGFSRGAYTARSLVGFIACVGILRRGAPLTVSQLWKAYCLLGRKIEGRKNAWSALFGEGEPGMRPLGDLLHDAWTAPGVAAAQRGEPAYRDGLDWNELNDTERLLVLWSRRAPITFLGVYDTVGAMGFDAFAIPGLQSKLALHHNMRPSRLIRHCRHALAIDEHRSGFRHTPMRAYLPHKSKDFLDTAAAEWHARVEQRWFVGAHSNIGGGYENNELAQRPLAWMLEGAQAAGLVCEPVLVVPAAVENPVPRDSFAEFAKPFWASFFRSKRVYREIDPAPEFHAPLENAPRAHAGQTIAPINEEIDSTVFDYWSRAVPPPNVVAFARRRVAAGQKDERLHRLAAVTPVHPWLGPRLAPHVILVLWATLIPQGVAWLEQTFGFDLIASWQSEWRGFLVGALWVAFDWLESGLNFSLALNRDQPRRSAIYRALFWPRALGVMLCMAGVLQLLVIASSRFFDPDNRLFWEGEIAVTFGLAAWPALLVLVLTLVAGVRGVRQQRGWEDESATAAGWRGMLSALGPRIAGTALGALATIALLLAAPTIAWGLKHAFEAIGLTVPQPTVYPPAFPSGPPLDMWLHRGGAALFLQMILFVLFASRGWTSRPLTDANLGSIRQLHYCATPKKIVRLFARWIARLSRPGVSPDEAVIHQLRHRLRESLWRDVLGTVPIYLMVFGISLQNEGFLPGGLWQAFHYDRPEPAHIWLVLAIILGCTMLANGFYAWFFEVVIAPAAEKPPRSLPAAALFAFALAWTRNLAIAGGLLVILTGLALSVQDSFRTVVDYNIVDYGFLAWRQMLVAAVTVLSVLTIGWILINALYFRWTTWRVRRAARIHHETAPASAAAKIGSSEGRRQRGHAGMGG